MSLKYFSVIKSGVDWTKRLNRRIWGARRWTHTSHRTALLRNKLVICVGSRNIMLDTGIHNTTLVTMEAISALDQRRDSIATGSVIMRLNQSDKRFWLWKQRFWDTDRDNTCCNGIIATLRREWLRYQSGPWEGANSQCNYFLLMTYTGWADPPPNMLGIRFSAFKKFFGLLICGNLIKMFSNKIKDVFMLTSVDSQSLMKIKIWPCLGQMY